MRSLLLLPLAAAAVGAAACRSPSDNPELGQVPQRDLTLQQTAAPQVEVASPVELARAVPLGHNTAAHARKTRRAARTAAAAPAPLAPVIADVPVSAPAAVATVPASPASYEAPDPHALAPGQTVTVLPASNAAGLAPTSTSDALPDAQRGDSRGVTIRGGGHAGSCGGRGGHPGGGGGFRGLR
jgi:hypothetical protein